MMSPIPWVIVPFARSEMLGNVWRNFERQTTVARLCLVENGPAVGACARAGLVPDLLLTSEAHQATAKNTALEEIRKRGGGLVALWDDDDWYAAGFLAELLDHRHLATVVGKRRHLIRMSSGIYLFDQHTADAPSTWLHGPTCLLRAEECVDFPRVTPNDDGEWCRDMARAGATFYATSPWNYVYDRTGTQHVWKASDVIVRHHMGDGLRWDGAAWVSAPKPTDRELFSFLAAN
jgi:hypothetical protein